MNNRSAKTKSWLLSTLIASVIAAGAFAAAFTHQRQISDYIQLRHYSAPATISQIATQDTLTDKARKIFYVNHPQVDGKASFNDSCPSGTAEKTIVLGCYKSDQDGIFLLNVTDPRLNGVKQVTAAHEMLHAAYDRLNQSQKDAINKQLMDYYQNGLTDTRIKNTINDYKKSEPSDVVNEMHSIFGTEVANLPSGLEHYYAQYFTKRSAVTDFSTQYQREFTSRRNQLQSDDTFLKTLKGDIDDRESKLKALQTEITNKQSDLTALRNSSNVAAYNQGVPVYNAMITTYNAQVVELRGLINDYNTLVTKRNALALEEDQLVKSLSAESQTINN